MTVKTSELKTIGASSIEQMLQGVVPGLSVVNTSAAPGAALRFVFAVRRPSPVMQTRYGYWMA